MSNTTDNPALRRFTKVVAASTFLLLLAGGMVTSTGSGLAVPDWPLSFGKVMPEMTGGVLYEHGHRMIATFVGFLILVQAFWLSRAEPRRWVRTLGWIALGGVIVQGLLGGLTVLLRLPDPVSVSHAALAQAIFGLTVAIALARSAGWIVSEKRTLDVKSPALVSLSAVTAVAIYAQIVLGAIVRHAGAGLAIPTFPLAYGELIPPLASRAIALHFAHRVGAVVVTLLIGWIAVRVRRQHRTVSDIYRPAMALAVLLVAQIGLGGWTVLSYKAAIITTAHLGTGALLFGLAVLLTLWAGRVLALSPQPVEHSPADRVEALTT